MNGICTLANDRVYHQLVALLNSIEAVGAAVGKDIPVCVYPYDDNTTQVAAEIARRPNVQLYDDWESIQRWQQFALKVWNTHPTARQRWGNDDPNFCYRMGMHHRFCAFDGPFDRFIYMDADTLLMNSVEFIFNQLDHDDWVVYDFQYKDPTHVYDVASPRLNEIFAPERIQTEIFCAGFYASKRNLFDQDRREWLIAQLANGESEILYSMAPDQTVLNYMAMRSGLSIHNFAFSLPPEQRTGCCVTSPGFVERDHILYDKEQPLTYLHYIGIKSHFFNRLCDGENIDFPYRDLFLHYRYLHEPENYPLLTGQPKQYNAPPSFQKRMLNKIGRSLKLVR